MFDYSVLAGSSPEDQNAVYQARELPRGRSAQEAALTLNPINQVPIESLVGPQSNLSPETQARIVDYMAKINSPPVAANQQQQQSQEPYHGFAGNSYPQNPGQVGSIVAIKNPDGTVTYTNNPVDMSTSTGTNLPYLLALAAERKKMLEEVQARNPQKKPVAEAPKPTPVVAVANPPVTPPSGLAGWLSWLTGPKKPLSVTDALVASEEPKIGTNATPNRWEGSDIPNKWEGSDVGGDWIDRRFYDASTQTTVPQRGKKLRFPFRLGQGNEAPVVVINPFY